MGDENWLHALNLHPSGLEEIGVSEFLRPERLKFEMSERSAWKEEREFLEFQWRPRILSRFLHSLDLFDHFGSSQNGQHTQKEKEPFDPASEEEKGLDTAPESKPSSVPT